MLAVKPTRLTAQFYGFMQRWETYELSVSARAPVSAGPVKLVGKRKINPG